MRKELNFQQHSTKIFLLAGTAALVSTHKQYLHDFNRLGVEVHKPVLA